MMTERRSFNDEESTTHERPSSFRDLLYRDRRLMSRRKMDRLLADRAAQRAEANGDDEYVTAFPALSRMFSGSTAAEWRAILFVIALMLGSFFVGRWVG